jgi:hypothetical protein
MRRALFLLIGFACAALGGCEKPGVKFHPGDRVFVKEHPSIRGVISMRLSPEKEDLYYIDIPAGTKSPKPIATEGDEFALIPPTRQYDGAYRERELEFDHQ